MKLKRIAVLVSKEFIFGPKNLIFIFAVVIPVLLSLFISLMVGSLFAGKPRLGIVDQGQSQLVENLTKLDYLIVREYNTPTTLREDVGRGALDMGVVLPVGFDTDLRSDAKPRLELFVWGESLLKHRTLLGVTLVQQSIDLAGQTLSIKTNTIRLGEEASVPWDVRLFPLVVIMTIILGGMMVPATFIVDEKQKHTLQALIVTPVSLGEVLAAKGITGVLISVVMGSVILTINRAWGSHPMLMISLLVLSAMLAAAGGVILGILVKDISTLFTAIKSIGILIYAPAFIYIFPQIPEWVGHIFPTYYMIGPIVEVSLNHASWREVATDMVILCSLIVLTVVAAILIAKHSKVSDT